MLQLFITDFIKNRTIQFILMLSGSIEILISKSINHSLILFGIPYLTSMALSYRYKPKKIKIPRISEQYRPK